MQYMLDANACILLLAGHSTVVGRAEQCEVGALAMSSIAFGEVAIGIARGKPPSLGQLDTLVRRIVTLLPLMKPRRVPIRRSRSVVAASIA